MYELQALQGKTWAQIASALHNLSSLIAQGALGAANYIIAAICKTTVAGPSTCAHRRRRPGSTRNSDTAAGPIRA